jgi:hypothetical protein
MNLMFTRWLPAAAGVLLVATALAHPAIAAPKPTIKKVAAPKTKTTAAPKPSTVKTTAPKAKTASAKVAKTSVKTTKATPAASKAPKAKTTTTTANAAAPSTTSTSATGTSSTAWTPTNPVAQKLSTKSNLLAKVQGVLGPTTDLNLATAGFKNFGQFVAAVNVSNNHDIAFADLKAAMTGQTMTGTPTGEPVLSLGQAIQKLKPGVDATAEAQRAQTQANAEID